MSNKEVIVISSSSSDNTSKKILTTSDVPNTPEPMVGPSRKRHIKWSRDYVNYWKKQGKCQKKMVIVISSSLSDESEEEEEESEEDEEESKEEEEEPEEDPELKSDADSHRESEDAIWGRDPKPSTSADSVESGVRSIPAVVSPPPRIQIWSRTT